MAKKIDRYKTLEVSSEIIQRAISTRLVVTLDVTGLASVGGFPLIDESSLKPLTGVVKSYSLAAAENRMLSRHISLADAQAKLVMIPWEWIDAKLKDSARSEGQLLACIKDIEVRCQKHARDIISAAAASERHMKNGLGSAPPTDEVGSERDKKDPSAERIVAELSRAAKFVKAVISEPAQPEEAPESRSSVEPKQVEHISVPPFEKVFPARKSSQRRKPEPLTGTITGLSTTKGRNRLIVDHRYAVDVGYAAGVELIGTRFNGFGVKQVASMPLYTIKEDVSSTESKPVIDDTGGVSTSKK